MLNKFYPLFLFLLLFFVGCSNEEEDVFASLTKSNDPKYSLSYEGLNFYKENLKNSSYRLPQLSDNDFNGLSEAKKLRVADKLLSTLFFGYSLYDLKTMINSGDFLTQISQKIETTTNDIASLESEILNEEKYSRYRYSQQEAIDILARFYIAPHLDRYFFDNWLAYILTQTIMFSPAYELDSSHSPNIERVYNRIVGLLEDDATMGYISYTHMMSEDNWRRFRSPEDNGREMLEIFLLDQRDSSVPKAAQALQNWSLNRDNDTLVVSLNENREPIELFGVTIYNGDDFYREMVKSDDFTRGVSSRLVDFFFGETQKKESIVDALVASNPQTFQDIVLQILFSKEYLLHTSRAKSAEETFFALTKRIDYRVNEKSFRDFKSDLEAMHQASMKYKLGKLTRVPLDTLSFASYHKMMRSDLLLRHSDEEYKEDYSSWRRLGWSDAFIANENFMYDPSEVKLSLDSLINYLFQSVVSRSATVDELALFENLMLTTRDGATILDAPFRMFYETKAEEYKRNIVFTVLDYLSRLENLYLYEELEDE